MSLGNLGSAHADGYRLLELADALPWHKTRAVIDLREGSVSERIPRSQAVPMSRLAAEVASWARDTPLLLVCEDGRTSAKAAVQLLGLGFTAVWVLAGGVNRWSARGMPLEASDDGLELGGEEG